VEFLPLGRDRRSVDKGVARMLEEEPLELAHPLTDSRSAC
jgi:hypothetical protein